jgi:hypothetical protein
MTAQEQFEHGYIRLLCWLGFAITASHVLAAGIAYAVAPLGSLGLWILVTAYLVGVSKYAQDHHREGATDG